MVRKLGLPGHHSTRTPGHHSTRTPLRLCHSGDGGNGLYLVMASMSQLSAEWPRASVADAGHGHGLVSSGY